MKAPIPATLLSSLCLVAACDKAGAGTSEPVITNPKVVPGMEPKEVAPGDAPVFAGDPKAETAEAEPAGDQQPVGELAIRADAVFARIMVGDRIVFQVDSIVYPSDCENVSVSLDPIEGRPDLRAFQVFCENGEDYFSREIGTYLVSMDTFELYWEGRGTYRNEMGVCQVIDVPWFEAKPEGKVVVYQETGVFNDAPDDPDVDCTAEPKKREDLETLVIPLPSR